MSVLNTLWNRIKTALVPKTKPPATKAAPQGVAAPPAPSPALELTASPPVRVEIPLESATTPDPLPFGTSVNAGSLSAGYAPAGLDAGAINEALCTQCRRYANGIAAQEVL